MQASWGWRRRWRWFWRLPGCPYRRGWPSCQRTIRIGSSRRRTTRFRRSTRCVRPCSCPRMRHARSRPKAISSSRASPGIWSGHCTTREPTGRSAWTTSAIQTRSTGCTRTFRTTGGISGSDSIPWGRLRRTDGRANTGKERAERRTCATTDAGSRPDCRWSSTSPARPGIRGPFPTRRACRRTRRRSCRLRASSFPGGSRRPRAVGSGWTCGRMAPASCPNRGLCRWPTSCSTSRDSRTTANTRVCFSRSG